MRSMRAIKYDSLDKRQLLAWLNELLETDYMKVDDLSDGVAFCQIVDAAFPTKVPLHKVVFEPKSEGERERNLRIFKRALAKADIHKEIPIASIAAGKFQDIFELLQWCYSFLHSIYPEADYKYPALDRRQAAMARASGVDGAAAAAATNNNLLPKSYSMRPGARRSPPSRAVLDARTLNDSGDGASSLDVSREEAAMPERSSRLVDSHALNEQFNSILAEASRDGFSLSLPPDDFELTEAKTAAGSSSDVVTELIQRAHADLEKGEIRLADLAAHVQAAQEMRDDLFDVLHEVEVLCTGNTSKFAREVMALLADCPDSFHEG